VRVLFKEADLERFILDGRVIMILNFTGYTV
jgi:hypothetical protein